MELKIAFQNASEQVKSLPSRPSNDQLLALYALYKQATEGDNQGKRPGMLDLKGRAKFDAWNARRGLPADQAMTEYIALVAKLRAGN